MKPNVLNSVLMAGTRCIQMLQKMDQIFTPVLSVNGPAVTVRTLQKRAQPALMVTFSTMLTTLVIQGSIGISHT